VKIESVASTIELKCSTRSGGKNDSTVVLNSLQPLESHTTRTAG